MSLDKDISFTASIAAFRTQIQIEIQDIVKLLSNNDSMARSSGQDVVAALARRSEW